MSGANPIQAFVRQFGGTATYDPAAAEDPLRRWRPDEPQISPEQRATDERAARIEAAAQQKAALDPPLAADLGVKTKGMLPKREAAIRLHTWIETLRRQLADLQTGREALLGKLGLPAVSEKALEVLEAEDKSGLLNWMRNGAKLAMPKLARQFEHEKLKEKLAAESYEADVAKSALAQIEEEADILTRQIELLERRRETAVLMAMVEHATPLGGEYVAAARNLEDKLAPLLGLGTVAGAVGDTYGDEGVVRKFYANGSRDATFHARLPTFGLSTIPGQWAADTGQWSGPGHPGGSAKSPEIKIDAARVRKEEAPWRDLKALWLRDPRAEPPARGG
jgi:hypothetical protein